MSPVESSAAVRKISEKEGSVSEKGFMKIRNNKKCYYLEEGIKSSLKLIILDIGSLQSRYCQLFVRCSRRGLKSRIDFKKLGKHS